MGLLLQGIVAALVMGRAIVQGSFVIGGVSMIVAELLIILSLGHFVGPAVASGGALKHAVVVPLAKSTGNVTSTRETRTLEREKRLRVEMARLGPPANAAKFRTLPDLGLFYGLFCSLLVFFMSNLQFVTFITYLLVLLLPHALPSPALWLVSRITLGTVPELPEGFQVRQSFAVWLEFVMAPVAWVMFFTTVLTLGVKGWQLSLCLALVAALSFGFVLNDLQDSPHINAVIMFTACNLVYLTATYPSRPETHGSRAWKHLRELDWLYQCFQDYFGLQILLTDTAKAQAQMLGKHESVIMGFHPHGIFPTTHIYLNSAPAFKALYPHLYAQIHPAIASIIHLVPAMRDVAQLAGCVDVSGRTLSHLFQKKESVQIVVGGQTEMFESRSWWRCIRLVRRKRRGLFALAIQHGVSMVPMFTFGETLIMDNLDLPSTQVPIKAMMGFPLPYWPFGRFALPFPRRRPVTVCIAEAVAPPCGQVDKPTEEQITEFQTLYFDKLEALFDEFKERAGHGDCYIEFMD
jgi:hypothetical protein